MQMNKLWIAATLGAALALAGCGTPPALYDPHVVQITFPCNPSGALLAFNNGKYPCGTTGNFTVTDESIQAGSVVVPSPVAIWVSGASLPVISIRADLSRCRNLIYQYQCTPLQFLLERPRDVPGYEKDASYALELERNELLRAQNAQLAAQAAQSQDNAFAAAILNGINNAQAAQAARRGVSTSCNTVGTHTSCTSN